MGYRIEYGPTEEKMRKSSGMVRRLQVLTAAFLLLFILLVRQAWPEGTAKLREFLLPGEPSVTQAAFGDLLTDIREGSPFREALTAFCQQVIDNG